MTIGIVVQARLNSKRLHGKVLSQLEKYNVLETLMKRIRKSKQVDKFILAMPVRDKIEQIIKLCNANKFEYYFGSEENVLKRYYFAAKKFKLKTIIRITADCPLSDPDLIDELLNKFLSLKVDCLSNTIERTYPDGLDIEIFTFNSLKKSYLEAKSTFDKEHVTQYIYKSNKFNIFHYKNDFDYSDYRITLDEIEDLQLIKKIYKKFSPSIYFNYKKIFKFIKKNKKLFEINKKYNLEKKSDLTDGNKLWIRANNIIAGGNMLLSKRPEMFLPNLWPTYFKKTNGVKVWDLNNNVYDDMLFAVGTNILGYNNKEINEAVTKTIQDGNMSSLNCPEEVILSEKLLEMHDYIEMLKFARSGGEANSIAIRIARAYTKNSKVAICGYHGWHDWYLATNLNNKKNLDKHLMKNLVSEGVPIELKDTVFSFEYNDLEKIEYLIKKIKVGTIKMEVFRNIKPKNNFLKKIRKLCDQYNVVLIFDECTSGFRQSYGGLHKIFNVEPDIVTFGKAIGNGYALTAVGGKKEIMSAANNTFISSTFWTERLGYTAAIKTLEIMKRIKSWEIITKTGVLIDQKWMKLAKKKQIEIETSGLPAIKSFNFKSKFNLEYKTLIAQEMLKEKILASNIIYVSTVHNRDLINKYFQVLELIFDKIKMCEDGMDVKKLLNTKTSNTTFKRMN